MYKFTLFLFFVFMGFLPLFASGQNSGSLSGQLLYKAGMHGLPNNPSLVHNLNAGKCNAQGSHYGCKCFFVQDSIDKTNRIVYIKNYSWGADSTNWYFGDSTSSRLVSPVHVYKYARPYLLCLVVSCPGGHFAWWCDTVSDTGLARFRGAGFTVKVRTVASGISEIAPTVLKTFPNPVLNQLQISLPIGFSGGTVSILNTMGERVLTQKLQNALLVNLDVSSIQAGTYLVQVLTSKGQYLNRIIKQ